MIYVFRWINNPKPQITAKTAAFLLNNSANQENLPVPETGAA
jgi:hypothetical protein